jgi:hypothetical protein
LFLQSRFLFYRNCGHSTTDLPGGREKDTPNVNGYVREISGTTLTIHPTVARFLNFMAGGFQKYQFRIEGNALTLSDKSSDSSYNLCGKVVPDPSPMSEERLKFVRVE